MRRTKYEVIANFQTLDEDGDWTNDYEEGDIIYRNVGTNKFEDSAGNTIIFKQEHIADYLERVG